MPTPLEIFDELTRAFNSLESFEKFYVSHLINKTPKKWRHELKSRLSEIKSYLNGIYEERIDKITVLLWLDKFRDWKDDINIVEHHLKSNIEEFEAYIDVPERIFGEDAVDSEMLVSGKTYEQIKAEFRPKIQQRIETLRSVLPFSDVNVSVVFSEYKEIEKAFASIRLDSDRFGTRKEQDKSLNSKMRAIPDKRSRTTGVKGKVEKSLPSILPFEMSYLAQSHLSILCDYWRKEGVIDDKTSAIDFRKTFVGKAHNSIIVWNKDIKDLKDFVNCMEKEGIIEKHKKKWHVAATYFKSKELGDITPANIRTSKKSEGGPPKFVTNGINILKSGLKP